MQLKLAHFSVYCNLFATLVVLLCGSFLGRWPYLDIKSKKIQWWLTRSTY